MFPIFMILLQSSSTERHWRKCAYEAQRCAAGAWNEGSFAVFWYWHCEI